MGLCVEVMVVVQFVSLSTGIGCGAAVAVGT